MHGSGSVEWVNVAIPNAKPVAMGSGVWMVASVCPIRCLCKCPGGEAPTPYSIVSMNVGSETDQISV